jgi:hypothetical protein
MAAADRASLTTVSMQSAPRLPAEMFFHGRAESAGAIAGVIGAVLVANAAKEPKEQILETMKTNGIELPTILRTEFFKAAAARGIFSLAETGTAAQGDLSLVVNVYGLGQTQGFSALLYPMINVSATLKKPNGEISWQRTEYILPLNAENKFGYEFEQYRQDPELIRKTFTNISAIVSNLLLESLSVGK